MYSDSGNEHVNGVHYYKLQLDTLYMYVVITSFHLVLWLHPGQQYFSQGQYIIVTAECMPGPNMMFQNLKAEEFHMIITAY